MACLCTVCRVRVPPTLPSLGSSSSLRELLSQLAIPQALPEWKYDPNIDRTSIEIVVRQRREKVPFSIDGLGPWNNNNQIPATKPETLISDEEIEDHIVEYAWPNDERRFEILDVTARIGLPSPDSQIDSQPDLKIQRHSLPLLILDLRKRHPNTLIGRHRVSTSKVLKSSARGSCFWQTLLL